jgi:hypothetical protein
MTKGPLAASDETPEKAGELMLSSDPIGSNGGKRAYRRRLGNDRSPRQSRHSFASAK